MVGVAIVLTLSGCPGPGGTANADERRLAVMRAEPLLKQATREPLAVAGFRVSDKLPVRRGQIQANLVDEGDADPPASARKHTAQAAAALRDNGWTMYYATCGPQDDRWAFQVNGYKVIDGVSYYAEVNGTGVKQSKVSVFLLLRAPNSRESTSDLFADRPPALQTGRSCVETVQLPQRVTADGVPIVLDEHGPEPDGTPKPPGHR